MSASANLHPSLFIVQPTNPRRSLYLCLSLSFANEGIGSMRQMKNVTKLIALATIGIKLTIHVISASLRLGRSVITNITVTETMEAAIARNAGPPLFGARVGRNSANRTGESSDSGIAYMTA